MGSLAKPPPEPPIFIATSKRTALKRKENVKFQLADRFHRAKTSTIFLCLVASFFLGCLSRIIFELAKLRTHTGPPISVCLTHQYRQVRTDDGGSFGAEDRPPPQTSNLNVGDYALEYIETMVHPAMLAHPNPSSVLIIGGAKHDADVQAILTEVFRHNSVERVAIVSSWMNPSVTDDGSDTIGQPLHRNLYTSGSKRVEYFDSSELLRGKGGEHHSPFDVVLLLRPFFVFSDIHSNQRNFTSEYKMDLSSLSSLAFRDVSQDSFMTKDGVLATHLGTSPYLVRKSKFDRRLNPKDCSSYLCTKHLQLKLIAQMSQGTSFRDLHIFEDPNGPGANTTRTQQSYVVLAKGKSSRGHWYAQESYLNYKIRKRMSSYPLFIDGSTLQRFNRPSKGWESLFCSFPEHKRVCSYMNGFDPAVPNIYSEEFEVKPSTLGKNVGRGLFAKVNIAEGSYLMQELIVHKIKFSVESFEIIFFFREMLEDFYDDYYNTSDDDEDKEEEDVDESSALLDDELGLYESLNQEYKFDIDSVIAFMDGYGYSDDSFGDSGQHADEGVNMFINHGCNKTFNIGPLFFVLDRINGNFNSEYEYLMLSEDDADPNTPPREFDNYIKYSNPLVDRHLEHFSILFNAEGSISNISMGDELFSNYLNYYGVGDSWKLGISDLRSQCRREKNGTIILIEEMSLH